MNIVIMRHGEAAAHANSDAERCLTRYGEEQARSAGQCLLKQNFIPDQCWVSPYTRTQQTKHEIEKPFGVLHSTTLSFLTPDNFPEKVIAAISAADCHNLLLISHLPLVSLLIGGLAHGSYRSGPSMAPASMAYLTAQEPLVGCFDLVWLRHAPNFEATH
jgi:phosphohistidine phosphatase